MTELPLEVPYGKVVGRFLLAVGDASDQDRLPDAKAPSGSITFTPLVSNFKTLTPEPATIVRIPIRCSLNETGKLIDPDGQEGVWLVSGFYRVSYALSQVTLASHVVEITTDYTDLSPLDLTTALPPVGGVPLTPTEYSELLSRISVLSATVDGLSAGGGDTPTEVISGIQAAEFTTSTLPRTSAGRLDLASLRWETFKWTAATGQEYNAKTEQVPPWTPWARESSNYGGIDILEDGVYEVGFFVSLGLAPAESFDWARFRITPVDSYWDVKNTSVDSFAANKGVNAYGRRAPKFLYANDIVALDLWGNPDVSNLAAFGPGPYGGGAKLVVNIRKLTT